jgi:hypothetical protein
MYLAAANGKPDSGTYQQHFMCNAVQRNAAAKLLAASCFTIMGC